MAQAGQAQQVMTARMAQYGRRLTTLPCAHGSATATFQQQTGFDSMLVFQPPVTVLGSAHGGDRSVIVVRAAVTEVIALIQTHKSNDNHYRLIVKSVLLFLCRAPSQSPSQQFRPGLLALLQNLSSALNCDNCG